MNAGYINQTMDKGKQGISGKEANKGVDLKIVEHENESFFQISNHDQMRPFFMSIVSDSNHWMFISSKGGLSAGRKNPDYALFPYYTDDKITESAEITGSKSIFLIHNDGDTFIWEPFSERCSDKLVVRRNLYKNLFGNKILFEETIQDPGLVFRYQWNSGKEFGFIRKAELINTSEKACRINILDGIQNIMPFGVPADLQRGTSNLVDAYKRNELDPASGIGIYSLSANIVDKAEPSEALKANIAWSLGLENATRLLSSLQLKKFRQNHEIEEEQDVKGEKGAYFVSAEISLPAKSSKKWKIIANVNQNHSQIIRLSKSIQEDSNLENLVERDIDSGTENLVRLVAAADGLQLTADKKNDARHFSNVLFNIMRGGVFDNNYQIKKADFLSYLFKANKDIVAGNQEFVKSLPDAFSQSALKELLKKSNDADLIRLSTEYLPLKFSRRHGDPSRPWNHFTINTQNETDGSEILDYEGNWRDLFQNWEALAHAYPEFTEGMIFKFLNASTFDGYNPYRLTRDGFDWETIEPDDPWSYIGYWGDHQIIYLQKFFEIIERYHPGTLQSFFDKEWFVYAAVPYIIKPYEQILKNPKDTIVFDHKWDAEIRKRREQMGADGTLLYSDGKEVYHVNFLEKILATILAKISNLIPEAGIWLNTQRPEWNDANNALVGNGASMVTLYYMHRFMVFFQGILEKYDAEKVKLSSELIEFYHSIRNTLQEFSPLLSEVVTDKNRKVIADQLGVAASEYRQHIYQKGFWGKKRSVSIAGLKDFTQVCLDYIRHSISVNQRDDKLFHAYNLISLTDTEISVSHLNEMLEGQVAVLSSGFLNPEEALEVLENMKSSALFRADQYSYLLYPNEGLPGFLQKNTIPPSDAKSSDLIKKMIAEGNKKIVEQDIQGGLHFNGSFTNAKDLERVLDSLQDGEYKELAEKERKLLLDIFEKVFNHKAFTGRSGTFFSYEGLGSIYWHMVSKLFLAAQECCLKAIDEKADPVVVGKLLDHYYEIQAGIGVHKSPELYGAFPTDPYSHTPQHRGAQQPGMTGQVKEDILSRFGELGVFVKDAQLCFDPCLLRKEEFLTEAAPFEYVPVNGGKEQIALKQGQLGFTFCSVPVIYSASNQEKVTVFYADGNTEELSGKCLTRDASKLVFKRNGKIDRLEVTLKND